MSERVLPYTGKMSRREFLLGISQLGYVAIRPADALQTLLEVGTGSTGNKREVLDTPDAIDTIIQELKGETFVDSSFLISSYLQKLGVPNATNNEGVDFAYEPGKKFPKSNTHAQTLWWQAEDPLANDVLLKLPELLQNIPKGEVLYFQSDSNQYGIYKFALAAIYLGENRYLSVLANGQAQELSQTELFSHIHGELTQTLQVNAWDFALQYKEEKMQERKDPEVTEDFSDVETAGVFFESYPELPPVKLQGVSNQVNAFYQDNAARPQHVFYVSYEDRVGVLLSIDAKGKYRIRKQLPVGVRLPDQSSPTDLGRYQLMQKDGALSYSVKNGQTDIPSRKIHNKNEPEYRKNDVIFAQRFELNFNGIFIDTPSDLFTEFTNTEVVLAPFTNCNLSRLFARNAEISAARYYQNQMEVLARSGREKMPISYDLDQSLEAIRSRHELIVLLYGMHNSWGRIAIKDNGNKTADIFEFIYNVELVMAKRQSMLGGNLGKHVDLIAYSPNGLNLDIYECAVRLMEKGFTISLNMKPAYEQMPEFLAHLEEIFGENSKLFPAGFLDKYPIGMSFDPENWGIHRRNKVSGTELNTIRQKYESLMVAHGHKTKNLAPMNIYNMGIGYDGFLVEVDHLDPQKFVLVNAGIAGVGEDAIVKKQQALDTSYKTFPAAAHLRDDGKTVGTFGVMFYDEPHLKNFSTLHENLTLAEQQQILRQNKGKLTYVASQ